ncbi:MAG: TIGR02281 family clan AA aspartic protease [Sphingomonadales bacterium]
MNGDDVSRMIAGGMMLMLVGSSLFARRLNFGQTLRMAIGWLAIFAVVFVLFLFREEGKAVWNRATTDIAGSRGTVSGSTLRVPMRDDGHFWIRATVNGREADFLVDSGATTTALSLDLAQSADVEIDEAFPVTLNTANGSIQAQTARITQLDVGPISQTNARAVVSAAFGETNVLGMSFLSSLKSWKVEGRTLLLQP